MTYEFKTVPYNHQLRALSAAAAERAAGRPGFAYLMDTRTGKSKVLIDEACELHEAGDLDGLLLLAPKGVYMNWVKDGPEDPGEFLSHMPGRIYSRARIVEWRAGGGGKLHSARLEGLLDPGDGGLRVLVMNSEALSSGTLGRGFAERFLRSCRAAMLAVDESVDFGDPSSNRTKVLIGEKKRAGLRDLARWRRILNGLLSPRGPLQVWSQFEVLEQGCLGFPSFWSFKARYAVTRRQVFGGRSVEVVVGYREEEDLKRRVARHSFRVRRDECWDLPKTIYTRRDVELTPEQVRLYAEMRDFAMMELGGGAFVAAPQVITQVLRLHQLVCGHVTDGDGVTRDIPTNRPAELLRVVGETDDKVIVWCHYRRDVVHVVAALEAEYGVGCAVEYHGGVERADRAPAIHSFQSDPSCRFFVATDAGAKGIKLTAAGTMVYYSNGYSLDKRSQSEDRPLGPDQKGAVNCVDLVAPGTVDEKILRILRGRIDLSSAIMGDGYREWLL